jgi:ABC-type lipoprotein release transport system permease subunit
VADADALSLTLRMAISTCAGAAAFMASVTVLACLAPARRALRIQPTDALN